jgi:outer membrane protein insertion porin family
MGKYNRNLEISPFERFQLGDAECQIVSEYWDTTSLHIGAILFIKTQIPSINPTEDVSQATRFFTIFNKYQLELRYPFATNPQSTIYGLAFFEAANGWYSFKEYNPFRLRRSAGVGMRFFLPMFGLLGFDYGIGIDRIKPGHGLKRCIQVYIYAGL